MSPRTLVRASVVSKLTPAWHYEYTIDRMLHHFDAETLEACLDALLRARTRSPHLTEIRIFEGGREYDSSELVA